MTSHINENEKDLGLTAFLCGGTEPVVATITIGELVEIQRKYYQLLYAVARRFPGETRFDTALRYIRQAESREVVEPEQAYQERH